jgi:hypothetical protein
MKQLFSAALVALLALAVIGCGKSAEQKKVEADLMSTVTGLISTAKTSLDQVGGVAEQIDAAVATHESLVAKYAKQTTGWSVADLAAAKDKLMGAKATLGDWVAGFKEYDLTMDHKQLVEKMTKDKEDLTAAVQGLEGAMTAATAAVESHKKAADELLAKFGPKGKK